VCFFFLPPFDGEQTMFVDCMERIKLLGPPLHPRVLTDDQQETLLLRQTAEVEMRQRPRPGQRYCVRPPSHSEPNNSINPDSEPTAERFSPHRIFKLKERHRGRPGSVRVGHASVSYRPNPIHKISGVKSNSKNYVPLTILMLTFHCGKTGIAIRV